MLRCAVFRAEYLGLKETELQVLIGQSNATTLVPLEEYLKQDESAAAPASPTDAIEMLELQDMLSRAIEKLSEKERTIVTLYYYEEMTLKEISIIMHLSEARISQLHTKAIVKMRSYLTRNKSI